MKPFVTSEKTKRQCCRAHGRRPPINRGKFGKQRSVMKWRSRKGSRRLAKVTVQVEAVQVGQDEFCAQVRALKTPEISVYAGAREHEGSCNGCQRRDNPTVFVVRLPSISIRVCADCARVVMAGLKTAVKNER